MGLFQKAVDLIVPAFRGVVFVMKVEFDLAETLINKVSQIPEVLENFLFVGQGKEPEPCVTGRKSTGITDTLNHSRITLYPTIQGATVWRFEMVYKGEEDVDWFFRQRPMSVSMRVVQERGDKPGIAPVL